MIVFIGGISFLIGVIIGSFLSVIVIRYGSNETFVTGRSHCRTCKSVIRWYDNIPLISYISLGGRCRTCKQKISALYPLIEVVTACTFAVIAINNSGSMLFLDSEHIIKIVLLWSIAAGLIVIFFYDVRTMHIPMMVVWYVMATIVIYILYKSFLMHNTLLLDGILSAGIGGFVGFTFLYLLSTLSHERWMGAGDAYIGLIGGLLLGWPAVIFFLTASFGIGALVGIILIFLKICNRKDIVPFAPFLIIGIVVTLYFPQFFPRIAHLLLYF